MFFTGERTLNIATIAGSASSEHNVSLASASNVYSILEELNYSVYPLYLDNHNQFLLIDQSIQNPYENTHLSQKVSLKKEGTLLYLLDKNHQVITTIDLFFPLMHGQYGEDGTIQGYLNLLGRPYIGSNVAASSVAIDKELTKIILNSAGIPTVPHIILYKEHKNTLSFLDVVSALKQSVLFVKPAKTGSSIGVSKVMDMESWDKSLNLAFNFDEKILIEPALVAREIEIAILEDENEVKASVAGEIVCHEHFYDYQQKYSPSSTAKLIVPAYIKNEILSNIQNLAIQTHKRIGCKSLSRVDFFITENEQIYVNEINTLPGFTSKSMYALLWQASGIGLKALVEKLIHNCLLGC